MPRGMAVLQRGTTTGQLCRLPWAAGLACVLIVCGVGADTPHGPGAECDAGYWWTGARCLPHTQPCTADQFEAHAPSASRDRACGACHEWCMPTLGCDGPAASDCRQAALVGVGANRVDWVLPDGSTRVAALLDGPPRDRVAGVRLAPTRSENWNVTAYVLTSSGRLWAANISAQREASGAALVAQLPRIAAGGSVLALGKDSHLYAVLSNHSLYEFDVETGVSTVLVGGDVAAVAAMRGAVYYATASQGAIFRFHPAVDEHVRVATDDAGGVTALDIDAAGGSVLWAGSDGVVRSAATSSPNSSAIALLSGLSDKVLGLSASPTSSNASVSLAVVDHAAAIPPLEETIVPSGFVRELSASTASSSTTSSDGAWAPKSTTQEGEQLGSWGNGVVPLGDINGDGVDDMAIGLPGTDAHPYSNAGAVLLFTRSLDGSPTLLQRISYNSGLDGTTLGISSYSSFGSSMAGLEDWDGDDVPELAVGAPNVPLSLPGSVWVLKLTTAGKVRVAHQIGNSVMDGAPLANHDAFGRGMCTVPDLDGDGHSEVAVGAVGADSGGVDRGAVYLLFLQSGDATYRSHIRLSGADGAGGFGLDSTAEQEFGSSLAVFSGAVDGSVILLCGVPGDDDGEIDSGAAYIIRLTAAQSPENVSAERIAKLSHTLGNLPLPPSEDDEWGAGLATIPDMDGNGVPEMLVGAQRRVGDGYVNLLFMEPGYTIAAQVRLDFGITANTNKGWFGTSLAYMGRTPIDKHVVAVAAPQSDIARSNDGAVFLVELIAPADVQFAPEVVELSAATQGSNPDAWAPDETIGGSDGVGDGHNALDWIGDIDGDGVGDLAVGAPYTGPGQVHFVRLNAGGGTLLSTLDKDTGLGPGVSLPLASGVRFGFSLAGVGDLNGDGVPDIAVSAYGEEAFAGAIYVAQLDRTGTAITAVRIGSSDMDGDPLATSDWFGVGMTRAPDFDGDGRSELFVGATGDDDDGDAVGAVYLLFLREGDGGYRTHLKFGGHQCIGSAFAATGQRFGQSLTWMKLPERLRSTGGTSMLMAVGTPLNSDSGTHSGAVYLVDLVVDAVSGNVTDFAKVSGTVGGLVEAGLPLVQADNWGSSVAAVGDLDGDGFPELFVGAERFLDYGFADIIRFDPDGWTVASGIRLSRSSNSPLPQAAKDRMESGAGWGLSVAFAGTTELGDTRMAIAAPRANGGAIFIIRMLGGARVHIVSKNVSLVTPLPAFQRRVGGVAVAAQFCSPDGCSSGSTAAVVPVALPPASRVISWAPQSGEPLAYVGGNRVGSVLLSGEQLDQVTPLGGDTDAVGAVWADVDLDGAADLLVASSNATNRLFLGSNLTREVGAAFGFNDTRPALAIAVGDCNGDRLLDVYIASPEGYDNTLLLNDRATRFEAYYDSFAADRDRSGVAIAWFDVDGSGSPDLMVGHLTSDITLLINDGRCAFLEAQGPTRAAIDGIGAAFGSGALLTSLVVIDANMDGTMDVVVIRAVGDAALLLGTHDGFSEPTFLPDRLERTGVRISASAGDVDDDGQQEVLLATSTGIRALSGAALTDVTDTILDGSLAHRDAGVVVAATATPGAGSSCAGGILALVDGYGGRHFRRSCSPARDLRALTVRVRQRSGGVDSLVYGAVVRLFEQTITGEKGAVAMSTIVDGGGNAVQRQGTITFTTARTDVLYRIEIVVPSLSGPRTMQVADLNVSESSLSTPATVTVRDVPWVHSLSVTPVDGCVAIGEHLVITLVALGNETGLLLAPSSNFNVVTNATTGLQEEWSEIGSGVYQLNHTVVEDEPDWPANSLPMSIVLRDVGFNVDSAATTWPAGRHAPCGDAHRPTSLFDTLPPEYTKERDAAFELTCTELRCSHEFAVDGGDWQPVSGGADDDGGSTAPDATGAPPPSVSLLSAPDRYSRQTSAQFSVVLHGTADSVLEYQVGTVVADRWVPAEGVAQLTFDDLAEGVHTVALRAGGSDASPVVYAWEVDTSAPVVEVVLPLAPAAGGMPASGYLDGMVSVKASEPGCTYRYRTLISTASGPDGQVPHNTTVSEWQESPTGNLVLSLPLGFDHRVEVAAVDRAGNVGAAAESSAAWPSCPEVEEVSMVLINTATGVVAVLDSKQDVALVETRVFLDDSQEWTAWQPHTSLRVVTPLSRTVAGAVEARAVSDCELLSGTRAQPIALQTWAVAADVGERPPTILSAPHSVTTQRSATFEFEAGGPDRDGGDLVSLGFECSYGMAPLGAAKAAIKFAGGANGGREPVWRACPAKYTLFPLPIGNQQLRVRGIGATAVAVYDWTVQAASDTSFEVNGMAPGRHDVSIRATDAAGNVQRPGTEHSFSWDVDITPPGTVAVVIGSSLRNSSNVPIAVSCTDEQYPQACSFCWNSSTLGGACSGITGNSELIIVVPEDPSMDTGHVVEVWAVDGAGNADPNHREVSFMIDREPPEVTSVQPIGDGERVWNGEVSQYYTRQQLLSAIVQLSELVVRVEVQASNGWSTVVTAEAPATAYDDVVLVGEPADDGAVLSITCWAVDVAGNRGPGEVVHVVFDRSAPSAQFVGLPSTTIAAQTVQLIVVPDDDADPLLQFSGTIVAAPPGSAATLVHPVVGVQPQCSRGEAAGVNFTVSGLTDGDYVVSVAATDCAGNTGAGSLAAFSIDRTPPRHQILVAPRQFTAATTAVIRFGVFDSLPVSAAIWVDGEQATTSMVHDDPAASVVMEYTSSFLDEATHEAVVWLEDSAGNSAAPVSIVWTVDTSDPTLSFTPHVESFTRANRWNVDVVCSDSSPMNVSFALGAQGSDDAQVDVFELPPPHGELTYVVESLAEGPYILDLACVDGAGNHFPDPATFSWFHDVSPPRLYASLWVTPALADGTADVAVAALRADSVSPDWNLDTGDPSHGADADVLSLPVSRTPSAVVEAVCVDEASGSPCTLRAHLELMYSGGSFCDAANAGDPQAGTGSADAEDQNSPLLDGIVTVVDGPERVLATDLRDGRWRLLLTATDAAGNVVQNHTSYEWWIDTAKPLRPTVTSDVDGATDQRYVVIGVDIEDSSPNLDDAKLWVQLDNLAPAQPAVSEGETERSITASVLLGGSLESGSLFPGLLDDGPHVATVWLEDAAGNQGLAETFAWEVQADTPETRIVVQPADKVGLNRVTVVIEPVAPGGAQLLKDGHVDVLLDGGGGVPAWRSVCHVGANETDSVRLASGVCVFQPTADALGTYVLQARAVSAVGRQDPSPASVSWTRSKCDGDEYAVINATSGALECETCPPGADCAADLVQRDEVQAKQGYWTGGDFSFYSCPRPASCLGSETDENGTVLPSRCAEGYAGRLW